jgi:hypothetical protein
MEPNLLEKYWNAETSLEEEKRLLEEMTGSDSPEAGYFTMIAKARQEKSKLTPIDLKSYTQPAIGGQVAVVLPLYRWIASAAAILIFIVAGMGLWNYSQQVTQPVQIAETFDDPYEAYEEVREALAFVSSKLNKSQNEALVNIKKAGEYADMFK